MILPCNPWSICWPYSQVYSFQDSPDLPEFYSKLDCLYFENLINSLSLNNTELLTKHKTLEKTAPPAAVVHLNFRVTFPVPVCTVPSSKDRTSRCNKVDAVRLYASYRLNLLLLKGQKCVAQKSFFSHARCLSHCHTFKRASKSSLHQI